MYIELALMENKAHLSCEDYRLGLASEIAFKQVAQRATMLT